MIFNYSCNPAPLVAALTSFLLLMSFVSPARSQTVDRFVVDGVPDEWESVMAGPDRAGDGGYVDFLGVQIADDSDHLLLRLTLSQQVVLQERNSITLLIDSDDDPSTGTPIAGMGADLRWTFGDRLGRFHGSTIAWSAIELVAMPSYSSTEFEISLRRDSSPGGSPLFTSPSIRIALHDDSRGGDRVPDGNSSFLYTFSDPPPPALPAISMDKDQSDHIRFMTYNVLGVGAPPGPWDPARTGSHARILVALQPDIIAFQEMYGISANQTVSWVEPLLPGPWHIASQGELKTLSRWPIRKTWETGLGRGLAALIELPPPHSRKMLIINLHLKCCNDDRQRQRQIDDIMAFVRDARTAGGEVDLPWSTPIIIAGDTNMYGDGHQVRTLVEGDIKDNATFGADFHPDWDGGPLTELLSRQLTEPQTYTWYERGNTFSPSHIDRIAYTSSSIAVAKSFVLHTPLLPSSVIASSVLTPGDTENASDHIPHVADFTLSNSPGSGTPPPSRLEIGAAPNPFNPEVQISFFLPGPGRVTIDVNDTSGRFVAQVIDEYRDGGDQTTRWDADDDLRSGIYFITIQFAGGRKSTKAVLLR